MVLKVRVSLGAVLIAGSLSVTAAAQAVKATDKQQPAKSAAAVKAAAAQTAWVARSNGYTQQLLDVQLKHSPESGSQQGLAKFDTEITDPSRADEIAQRKELVGLLEQQKAAAVKERDENVREDLEILQKTFYLQFRQDDYQQEHKVPFLNASQLIFGGLRGLLDDQMPAERRPAAVVRLRKYAGMEPGYKPFTDRLKERVEEQMAKPGAIYPSAGEMETELGRNKAYIDGMSSLFRKYNLTGWQEPFAKLVEELSEYDAWVRETELPKGRKDFRLQPEEYALGLEGYGVDVKPEELAGQAHAAFTEIQGEMGPLAAEVAKAHGWKSTDYRDVIKELKKTQIPANEELAFYTARLKAIEALIREHNLVTLPERPAIIRMATAAETAQQPAPHMVPPPFLNNTGQRGEFVLPTEIPAAAGAAAEKYDDFGFDAVAWTLTAHEARPGHELQFDSMLEHGVSLARALYAFNSTNVEGWGLYSEWVMEPYEPAEGRLLTLQLRLLRAARAFLDPELQSGKISDAQAYLVLEGDVMLSHAFAKEEVERFTYRSPGQATSYFYGYTKMLGLRKDAEAAMGKKFDARKFHDFVLAQGLLPPELMRKAVMEGFVKGKR